MSNEIKRGTEIRNPAEYLGVRLYVGTAPYGRKFIVAKESFAEVCEWFDAMEAKGWNE